MTEEALGHYLAPWCVEDDIPPRRVDRVRDVDIGLAIAAATDLLFVASGRRYRSGRSVVRPTANNSGWWYQNSLYPYSSMSGYGSAWGWAAGWAWTAVGMGWWQTGQDSAECVLQGPIRKINSVTVDGAILAPSAYAVYDKRRLVRLIDPTGQTSGAWPWEQNLQLSADQPGTWSVDYEWGQTPPALGRVACIELAIEIALGLSGDDELPSKLPARVVSVATQGVTVAVGNPIEYLREELTGIPLCDLFINTYNPARLRRKSTVLAPNSTVLREVTPGVT